jgi:hypothetical protein
MWTLNGITGRAENPPGCAGNFSGRAVVMGCGRCIWDDLAQVKDLDRIGVIAINNMILHHKGRVHHGVSMHPEEPNLWRALRPYYQGEGSHVHTHSYMKHGKIGLSECDVIWGIIEGSGGGTSGILATMIGLALGYDEIILAGVPLDNSGHFYDPPGLEVKTFGSDFIKIEWTNTANNYFQGRVKSLSGWSRELLGGP